MTGPDPAGRWSLAGHPSFWLACSLLFATNAVLSGLRGDWWLVALEIGTALLALVAAAAVADFRPPRRAR